MVTRRDLKSLDCRFDADHPYKSTTSRTMKKQTRRAIRFEGTGQEFEIHKVVAINSDIPTLLSFERMKDGKIRMTYNAVQIPDFSKIEGITIVRENGDD